MNLGLTRPPNPWRPGNVVPTTTTVGGMGWGGWLARRPRFRGRRQGSRGLLLRPQPGQGGNGGGLLASGWPGLPPPPLPRSPLYFPSSLSWLGSAGEP